MTAPPKPSADPALPVLASQTPIYADTLDKRQLADSMDDAEIGLEPSPAAALPVRLDNTPGTPTRAQPSLNVPEVPATPIGPEFPYIYSPMPVLNHKEYVENKIQEERLPPGVTRINARNYILRYVPIPTSSPSLFPTLPLY